MDNINVKKNTSLKCGLVIKILSIIALICGALGCLSYFFTYYSISKLVFYFPSFQRFISFLLTLAPFVLFVLYVFKFHNKLKTTILVPITFGLIAFEPIYSFICYWFIDRPYYEQSINFKGLIFDIPIIAAFVLACVNALKGFSKKIFIIIAIAVGLIYELLAVIDSPLIIEWYLEQKLYLGAFTWFISIFGTITLYIALLLFGLKNRTPVILSVSPKIVNPQQYPHQYN